MAPREKDITDARQAFTDALLLEDKHGAKQLSAAECRSFTRHLLKTINKCTRTNIQLCTSFVMTYIKPSPDRLTAFGEYLSRLSLDCKAEKPIKTRLISFDVVDGDIYEGLIPRGDNYRILRRPMPSRRRLHILHILNDVLLELNQDVPLASGEDTITYREACSLDDNSPTSASQQILSLAIMLLSFAACQGYRAEDQVLEQLQLVLSNWQTLNILSDVDDLKSILDSYKSRRVTDAESLYQGERKVQVKKAEQAIIDLTKWRLPERHGVQGDPSPAWHRLPAANALFMKRTRGFPMKTMAFPQGGYELKNGGRDASEELKREVTVLHKEALRAFDVYTNPEEVQDIDPLGNIVWKDPDRATRNYYGRTHDGVEKQKAAEHEARWNSTGYADVRKPMHEPDPTGSFSRISDAPERARKLADEARRRMEQGESLGFARGNTYHHRGYGDSRGGFRGGSGGGNGFRGGGFRGARGYDRGGRGYDRGGRGNRGRGGGGYRGGQRGDYGGDYRGRPY